MLSGTMLTKAWTPRPSVFRIVATTTALGRLRVPFYFGLLKPQLRSAHSTCLSISDCSSHTALGGVHLPLDFGLFEPQLRSVDSAYLSISDRRNHNWARWTPRSFLFQIVEITTALSALYSPFAFELFEPQLRSVDSTCLWISNSWNHDCAWCTIQQCWHN